MSDRIHLASLFTAAALANEAVEANVPTEDGSTPQPPRVLVYRKSRVVAMASPMLAYASFPPESHALHWRERAKSIPPEAVEWLGRQSAQGVDLPADTACISSVIPSGWSGFSVPGRDIFCVDSGIDLRAFRMAAEAGVGGPQTFEPSLTVLDAALFNAMATATQTLAGLVRGSLDTRLCFSVYMGDNGMELHASSRDSRTHVFYVAGAYVSRHSRSPLESARIFQRENQSTNTRSENES